MPTNLAPSSQFSAWVSFAVAYLIAGLGFAGVIVSQVIAAIRLRRRARDDAGLAESSVQRRSGRAILIGIARSKDPDSDTDIVRTVIRQDGTERYNAKSRTWAHTWKEVGRTTKAVPFVLELSNGERVAVQPGPRVVHWDELDGVRSTGAKSRERTAVIRAGDRVFVDGTLTEEVSPDAAGGGYRAAPRGRAFRDVGGAPMRISSLDLRDETLARARFHGRWAVILGAAFIALHVVVLARFHQLAWRGIEVRLPVSHMGIQWERRSSRGRSYSVPRYYVEALWRAPSGEMRWLHAETNRAFHDSIESPGSLMGVIDDEVARTVTFRFVPSDPTNCQLGSSPALVLWEFWAALIATFAMSAAYLLRRDATAPWYSKRLIEMGSGKL